MQMLATKSKTHGVIKSACAKTDASIMYARIMANKDDDKLIPMAMINQEVQYAESVIPTTRKLPINPSCFSLAKYTEHSKTLDSINTKDRIIPTRSASTDVFSSL